MMTLARRSGPAVALIVAALVATGSSPARAAATDWVGDVHAAARLVTAVAATGSATRLDAGLQIRLAPGWHTYWRSPGDAGIPATLDWQGSGNTTGFDVAWPAPLRFTVSGLETVGYEDGVVLPISVTLAEPGKPVHLVVQADYAACSNVCVPYHANLAVDLPAGLATPDPESMLIAAARDRVPGSLDALGARMLGATIADRGNGTELAVRLDRRLRGMRPFDVFVEGLANASTGGARVEPFGSGMVARVPISGARAASIANKPLTLTMVAGTRSAEFQVTPSLGPLPLADRPSLPAILGIALLGGLILNLMPCVLPVLGLKLLTIAGTAGVDRADARRGLLASAAGVLASFAVLAAGVVGLRAAGLAIGWGIQFQQPWFLAGMAVATTLFAANLWGWLTVGLPAGATTAMVAVRSPRRLVNAFLSGAFATALASSCSAPFVGTAVGFGLSGGVGDVALAFAGLGLGMAAPLLAGAAWPGFARWLPRPGHWMRRLRQVLGAALLGTTAWLLVVLDVVAGRAASATLATILFGLLVVLVCRGRMTRGGSQRPTWVAVAGFAALALLAVTIQDRARATPAVAAEAGPWRLFVPAEIERALARGDVVLVDVSAVWCLTCKLNDANVLSRSPVRDRLRAPGTIAMRADWSRPDAAITRYLQSFGRFGVPMDVVYGPGAPGGIVLPELLSASAVTEALDRAAAGHLSEVKS